jgi:N utilization substance protein A
VASFEFFTPQMLVTLGDKGIKSLDDLADLAGDELVEILGADALDEASANEIIMAARAHWFEGEEGAPSSEGAEAAPAAEDTVEDGGSND